MLNDTLKSGCQTKWRYIIILVFTAAIALGTAFLLEQGQPLRYLGRKLSMEDSWEPWDGTNQKLCFEAGGKTLRVGAEEIPVPCGIDAVISGEEALAVITSGSGVLTRTVFYDDQAQALGKIDLKDRAMLRGVFLDGCFLGLCYGKDGSWSLLACGLDGSILAEKGLETEIYCDLLGLDTGFVVETEDALLFYNDELEPVGTYLLGSRQVAAWAGEDDLLAVVFYHQGEYYLESFYHTEAVAQCRIPMEIRDLAVVQGNICILDFESLRVYDAFCNCYAVSTEGARAVSLETCKNGLWLRGEAEALYFTS